MKINVEKPVEKNMIKNKNIKNNNKNDNQIKCNFDECDNRMFEYGSCMNKTYDAMMSGKPIIFANPAPNNYILEYDCGYNAIPENAEDLERCIREFSDASEQELAEKGERGKQAIVNCFDYNVLSKDFENIMIEVCNKKREERKS